MAQQKKFSNLQPPTRTRKQGLPDSRNPEVSSRLKPATQQGGYLAELSGIVKRPQTSFPPQKKMPLPGFTYYFTVPPLPQILLSENNESIITENDDTIILDPPL